MSVITLQPAATTTTTTLGVADGRWYANGTDNPDGAVAWLKHSVGATDLTWQMGNTTAGQWLTVSNIFTTDQWDAAPGPVDLDGFKPIGLTVTPTWATPTAGDAIDFQTSGAGWELKTGTLTGGRYELVATVPELSGLGMVFALLGCVCVEQIMRRCHGRIHNRG